MATAVGKTHKMGRREKLRTRRGEEENASTSLISRAGAYYILCVSHCRPHNFPGYKPQPLKTAGYAG